MSGYESAIFQWREGQQRLRDAEPADRAILERVTGRIVDELRRRLGGAFTTGELAELYYEQGTDWCLDIAVVTAPGNPRAWDSQTVPTRPSLGTCAGRSTSPAGDGSRRTDGSAYSSSSPPERRITICSSSTVTVMGRWPAQCSA